MESEIFWSNVKKQIKLQNTTQEWLCSKCGFVLSSFRNRISLKRFPTVDEAYKIAQALGVSMEYLVTGKEPSANNKRQELKNLLLQAIDKVDGL